jgi:Rrf2 family transcriptional regulator, iron-sulfur cluster assembly transcription factor
MLNHTTEYAILAATIIARDSSNGPVFSWEIADETNMPPNYLSKVLHQLTRAGILMSLRGKKGGFTLGRAAKKIKLMDIAMIFEDVRSSRQCLLNNELCSDTKKCALHDLWGPVSEKIERFFQDTSLEDAVASARKLGYVATPAKKSLRLFGKLSKSAKASGKAPKKGRSSKA